MKKKRIADHRRDSMAMEFWPRNEGARKTFSLLVGSINDYYQGIRLKADTEIDPDQLSLC
jgi:hypothetical protein